MSGRRRAPADHRTRVGRERSARTETRIVAAAMKVFAERGPDAPVVEDFVQASGVARGTFYNHFQSVEELLHATSAWTTRQVLEGIEAAMAPIEGPALRLGVGLRLFLRHAQRDPTWCNFVARVWTLGGLELPSRDLTAGIAAGQFRVPGPEAAYDLLFGGLREALRRLGTGQAPRGFGDQVVELALHLLGAPPRVVAAVLAHPLPDLSPAQRP